SRNGLPKEVAPLLWFGTDDAATSYLTPCYVNSTAVPDCFKEGNGDLLHYSDESAFWICNRVAQACYKMYNFMEPVVREQIDRFETEQIEQAVPQMDAKLCKLVQKKHNAQAIKQMTRFTCKTAQKQFENWCSLEELLLVKFIDGNVKAQNEDGSFKHSQYHEGTPDGLTQPGYTEKWKRSTVLDNGPELLVH
ncbi:MAG: C69 family dipeptidase, partial [Candidatus Cryptobacteroides sp.]